MSKTVISIQNLSKYYRLGVIGGATFREEFSRYWARKFGRPDPYARIGQADHGNREGGQIWALRDINLEVSEGEILGIIGRNGAGKSTLLKILSRITAPTSGRAVIRGRVGSLLEVGTGFHPELTGRENIYLNGTILGMTKAEVDRKLEEIVEFAEIPKFIDTPVKRYSSGMTVRLAFAVAAHLEPEILVVDEVLAVGDAEFQKKCLGKMGNVASHGRTVLFVSHNTNAIQALCANCVLLDHGTLITLDNTAAVIEKYLLQIDSGGGFIHVDEKCLRLVGAGAKYVIVKDKSSQINIDLEFKSMASLNGVYIDFGLENQNGIRLLQIVSRADGQIPISLARGERIKYQVEMSASELAPGEYFCTAYAHSASGKVYLHQSSIPLFRVGAREDNRECMSRGFTAVLLPKYKTTIQVVAVV